MKRISGLGIDSITLNEVHEVYMDRPRNISTAIGVGLPMNILEKLSNASSELNVSIAEILRGLAIEFASSYDSIHAQNVETIKTKAPKTRRYGKFLRIRIDKKIALPLIEFTGKHNSTIQDLLRAMFARITDTQIHTNKHIDHTLPDLLVKFVESINLDNAIDQSRSKKEIIGDDGIDVQIYASMDLHKRITDLCKQYRVIPANLGRTLARLAVEHALEVEQTQDE